MERVKLLSADQSSSEVRMATTGQTNHTGSTRTKATQALISHFMSLAGVMLIELLTLEKAADYVNVSVSDATNLTISGTVASGASGATITLAVAEGSTGTYKILSCLA